MGFPDGKLVTGMEKAASQRPEPGVEEWAIKSHPDYDGCYGERTTWEFACSEIR